MKFKEFLYNPNRSLISSLEFCIVGLVFIYFTILFFSSYQLIGLEEPILKIPDWLKDVNNMILWLLFSTLLVELILNYFKTSDNRKFLRSYYPDIVMVILIPLFVVVIPFFAGIKLFKLVKIAKQAKIAKYGYKSLDKGKKFSKNKKLS